jgi:hypothetical protein
VCSEVLFPRRHKERGEAGGVCFEKTWPYQVTMFTVKPSAPAYTGASKYQVTSYSRLTQTLTQLKGCLASGYSFVFGFTYDHF